MSYTCNSFYSNLPCSVPIRQLVDTAIGASERGCRTSNSSTSNNIYYVEGICYIASYEPAAIGLGKKRSRKLWYMMSYVIPGVYLCCTFGARVLHFWCQGAALFWHFLGTVFSICLQGNIFKFLTDSFSGK